MTTFTLKGHWARMRQVMVESIEALFSLHKSINGRPSRNYRDGWKDWSGDELFGRLLGERKAYLIDICLRTAQQIGRQTREFVDIGFNPDNVSLERVEDRHQELQDKLLGKKGEEKKGGGPDRKSFDEAQATVAKGNTGGGEQKGERDEAEERGRLIRSCLQKVPRLKALRISVGGMSPDEAFVKIDKSAPLETLRQLEQAIVAEIGELMAKQKGGKGEAAASTAPAADKLPDPFAEPAADEGGEKPAVAAAGPTSGETTGEGGEADVKVKAAPEPKAAKKAKDGRSSKQLKPPPKGDGKARKARLRRDEKQKRKGDGPNGASGERGSGKHETAPAN